MNNHELWQSVLAELELSISKANFITWFKSTGIISWQDGCVLVCVPNTFNRAWLEKNTTAPSLSPWKELPPSLLKIGVQNRQY